jgi:hypothetical protein
LRRHYADRQELTARVALPLSARVPIVSRGLILVVALLGSRVMMSIVAREQESGVRRIEALYLDGVECSQSYSHQGDMSGKPDAT